MNYAITLIAGNREIGLPVLPETFSVRSPGTNDKQTVIGLGEILVLDRIGLRAVSWKSFFPAATAPYVTGPVVNPIAAVRAIQAARDASAPIRLLITGTDLDINVRFGVESFDYEERAGEAGDIYYEIKLIEWKDYAPKRIILPTAAAAPAKVSAPARAGAPPKPKTHTVSRGDTLWDIAQKYYGQGSRYAEVYTANRAAIDGRNKGRGNPKYTIYSGQVLTIP